ncbi:hypothetical protein D1BOALGB6SA_5498 [Olavius sp. associated proteobacterium Delta 1]|nr:hypothetical protein D1BOALGB6SA_5498 [Olavius sp. associated proteobacterium Delta 1]
MLRERFACGVPGTIQSLRKVGAPDNGLFVVTLSLTHKGNFSTVLPIKSNILSHKDTAVLMMK